MQLQELQAQIQQHAQSARALITPELLSSWDAGFIEKKAELQEWTQIIITLEYSENKSSFSPDALRELWLARQAMNLHISIVAEKMLASLSDEDRKVIGECLHALADGPFIPDDDELHAVTGLTRDELRFVAKAWPDIKKERAGWSPTYEIPDFISLSYLAVSGTLNNLTGYPHGKERQWLKEKQVERICDEWFALRRRISDSFR